MLKKALIWIALFFSTGLCVFAAAPPFQWAIRIPGATVSELIADDFGNCYVALRSASGPLIKVDSLSVTAQSAVAKVDSQGQCQWLTGLRSPEFHVVQGLTKDIDGNLNITT